MIEAAECPCGSGLPFSRCHGDSRNEYARTQALREAESLGFMFPFVRVQGVDVFVERAATAVPGGDVPDSLLAEGVAEVDSRERRRVVELWANSYADRWESLVTTAADAEAAAQAVVAGAKDRRSLSARLDATQDVAFALMSFDHIRRTRSLAARLRTELPFNGLLRASHILDEACDGVETQLEAAREATGALLIAYSQQLIADKAG